MLWAGGVSPPRPVTALLTRTMTTSNQPFTGPATLPACMRRPHRVTITISWQTWQRLLNRSDDEGRSLSNLAAHLLEVAFLPH